MSDPVPPKKRRGCFFYGCITSVAVALVLVLIVVFGVKQFAKYVNTQILLYTDTAPAPLPKAELASNELAQFQDRVSAFNKALDAHTNTPPLTLTADELNVLLDNNATVRKLKLNDRFYLSLSGDQINGQISLPLADYFKAPSIKSEGRYLNGDAVLGVVFTNSQLFLPVKSMEVKGTNLPPGFLSWFQAMEADTMTNVNENPTNRAYLDRIESAEVKDGVLVIKAKQ